MTCQKPEIVSVERKGLELKPILKSVKRVCKHAWEK